MSEPSMAVFGKISGGAPSPRRQLWDIFSGAASGFFRLCASERKILLSRFDRAGFPT
jgi:hypothetical protein